MWLCDCYSACSYVVIYFFHISHPPKAESKLFSQEIAEIHKKTKQLKEEREREIPHTEFLRNSYWCKELLLKKRRNNINIK